MVATSPTPSLFHCRCVLGPDQAAQLQEDPHSAPCEESGTLGERRALSALLLPASACEESRTLGQKRALSALLLPASAFAGRRGTGSIISRIAATVAHGKT
jgi:hypothetical protein